MICETAPFGVDLTESCNEHIQRILYEGIKLIDYSLDINVNRCNKRAYKIAIF